MAEGTSQRYFCLSCSFQNSDQNNFINHSRIHQHESNFGIRCFFCPQILGSLKSHKKHVSNCIPKTNTNPERTSKENEAENTVWLCKNCQETIAVKKCQTAMISKVFLSIFTPMQRKCLLNVQFVMYHTVYISLSSIISIYTNGGKKSRYQE